MHYMGLFFLDGKWIYLLPVRINENATTNCYLSADHLRLLLVSTYPFLYWYPATYRRCRYKDGRGAIRAA